MSFMDKRPYMRQKATDRSRYLAQRRRFREAEREKKRRQRVQEGRERLNRLFHAKVPKPQQFSIDKAEVVDELEATATKSMHVMP